MLIRSDAISEAAMGAAKVTREAVQTASEKWCEMINALAVVNGPVAYEHIIDHINQPVSESYNVVARRRSRKTSDKDTAPFLPRTHWNRRPWKNNFIDFSWPTESRPGKSLSSWY